MLRLAATKGQLCDVCVYGGGSAALCACFPERLKDYREQGRLPSQPRLYREFQTYYTHETHTNTTHTHTHTHTGFNALSGSTNYITYAGNQIYPG